MRSTALFLPYQYDKIRLRQGEKIMLPYLYNKSLEVLLLSTIEEIIPQLNQSAYDYIGKYMDKGGKAMWSRNIPTFIKCAVRKKDILGPTNEDETSFLVSDEAEIVTEYGEIIKLNKEKVCKVLPQVTTCN